MNKKPRIGRDPLKWIKKTKGEKSKQDKQSLQSKQILQSKPKVKEGLREGFTRATFIVKEDYLDKLKALAYWERKRIREVINEALSSYLKGKKIRPIKKGKGENETDNG